VNTYSLTIPGNPIPKARPRIVNGRAYTPERTAEWEEIVRNTAMLQWTGRPLGGPLSILMHFSRKNRRRCDLDNLVKAVLDGLQGVVFADDWQIVTLAASKSVNRDDPGVEIEIEELAGW